MIEKIKKRITYLQNQIDENNRVKEDNFKLWDEVDNMTYATEQSRLKNEQSFLKSLIKENISDSSVVGILWSSGTKEFITSCDGGFCTTNIKNGVHRSTIVEKSKQKLIDRFNSKNVLTLEVFTFDTEKDLYKWLSE